MAGLRAKDSVLVPEVCSKPSLIQRIPAVRMLLPRGNRVVDYQYGALMILIHAFCSRWRSLSVVTVASPMRRSP